MDMEFMPVRGHDGVEHPVPLFLLVEPIYFVSAAGNDGAFLPLFN